MLRQLGEFITKRPLAVVAIWAIILIVSVPLAMNLDGRLHYDITSFIPKNLESYSEKTAYDAQFPDVYKSQIIVAVDSSNKTEAMLFIDRLNRTVEADDRIKNETGTASIYDIQRQALVSMTPELHSTMYDIYDNTSKADIDLYDARDTVKNTSGQLYDLRDSVLQTSVGLQSGYNTVKSSNAQLYSARDQVSAARDGLQQIRGAADIIYGLPLTYSGTIAQANGSGASFDAAKAMAIHSVNGKISSISDPTFNTLATQYMGAFEGAFDAKWQASYAADPAGTLSGWQAIAGGILSDPGFKNGVLSTVPSSYKPMLSQLLSLGLSGYQDPGKLQAMVVQLAMANLPSGMSAQQAQSMLNALYPTLGASSSYANGVIDQLTLQAATQGRSSNETAAVYEIYALGRNPSHDAIATYVVDKACEGRNDTEQKVIRDVWNMGDMSVDVVDNYVLTKAGEDLNQTEKDQIKDIYAMGKNPNDTVVDTYVLSQATKDLNQTESDFVRGVYALGRNASNDSLKAFVCGKVVDNMNATGNLSYFTAVMAIDRNATNASIESFARDWAYSHDYTNPNLFPEGVADSLASGNLTLYAVMLSDDDAMKETKDTVGYVRDDVASVQQSGEFPGVQAYVTGVAAFSVDTMTSATKDIDNIDKISVVLILLILGVYFLSILTPFIPLAVVGAAVVTGFGALYLASYNVDLYYLTKTFMIVVMLGAGTDYCVFILSRYAEERAKGVEVKESVIYALEHAGKSVLCSGTTAMIGFASLMLIDNGIFNSMGQSMAIAVLVSMLVAMTLMPAVMTLAGDRLFWPRKIYNTGTKVSRTGHAMKSITHQVIKHWKLVLVATVLLAVPAIWLYVNMGQSEDFISMMPNNVESKVGYDMINDQFGSGNIEKTQVLVTLPQSLKDGDNYSTSALDEVEQISALAASVDGVDKVYSATRPNGETINYANLSSYSATNEAYYNETMNNSTGIDGHTTVIQVAFVGSPYSDETKHATDVIRQKMADYESAHPGVSILVGGAATMGFDYQKFCSDKFPLVVIAVFVGIFLVLMYLLRSIWTPVRMFLSMLLNIVWTLGVFTLVFQYWQQVPVIWILPIVLFCVLMGLGGDYVVFMTSRVREEVDKGKSDEEAIENAVEATGPVILLCGLVMASAFGSMMVSNMAELQEFGFALSLAIMLDATLMVVVLIPSVMMLLKKYNWWMPFSKPASQEHASGEMEK